VEFLSEKEEKLVLQKKKTMKKKTRMKKRMKNEKMINYLCLKYYPSLIILYFKDKK
jgi:hypothetical protein